MAIESGNRQPESEDPVGGFDLFSDVRARISEYDQQLAEREEAARQEAERLKQEADQRASAPQSSPRSLFPGRRPAERSDIEPEARVVEPSPQSGDRFYERGRIGVPEGTRSVTVKIHGRVHDLGAAVRLGSSPATPKTVRPEERHEADLSSSETDAHSSDDSTPAKNSQLFDSVRSRGSFVLDRVRTAVNDLGPEPGGFDTAVMQLKPELTNNNGGDMSEAVGQEVARMEADGIEKHLQEAEVERLANGQVLQPLPELPNRLNFSAYRRVTEEREQIELRNDLVKMDAEHVGVKPVDPYSHLPEIRNAILATVDEYLPPQATGEVRGVFQLFGTRHGEGAYVSNIKAVQERGGDIAEEYRALVPNLVAHNQNGAFVDLAESAKQQGVESIIDPSIPPKDATVHALGALGLKPEFEYKGFLHYDGHEVTAAMKRARQQRAEFLEDPTADAIVLEGSGATEAQDNLGVHVLVDRQIPYRVARKFKDGDAVLTDVGTSYDGLAIIRDNKDIDDGNGQVERRYLLGWDSRLTHAPGATETVTREIDGQTEEEEVHTQDLLVRAKAVALHPNIVDFVRLAVQGDGVLTNGQPVAVGTKIAYSYGVVYDPAEGDSWMTDTERVGEVQQDVSPLELQAGGVADHNESHVSNGKVSTGGSYVVDAEIVPESQH